VPPALNSIAASSVTAPNSSVAGSLPSASGVTPPNSGVPSSVPSSSGVTPPGSSPGTATGVTPPTGGGKVTPQNFRINGGPCIQSWVFGSLSDTDCHDWDVDALQRKADALKEEIKNSTGRSPQERASLEFDLAKVQAQRLDLTHPNTGGASGKASVEAMVNAPVYQKMTPVEKLAYWQVLNYGMESGNVGAKDLANTAGAMWGIGQNKNVLALYPELSGKGLPTGIGSSGGFDASLALFGLAFAGTGEGLSLGIATTAGSLACPVCVAALAIAGGALVIHGTFVLGRRIAAAIQGVFHASGVSLGILKSASEAPKEVQIGKKAEKDMAKRNWTEEEVLDTVNNPADTKPVTDNRNNPDGTSMNDPATAYIRPDGSYVIVNDRTGEVVQVSPHPIPPGWLLPWK
jgi:Colicin E5 ribonuclease domain